MVDLHTPSSEEEALLSFLYMCPVGVMRVTASGDVRMMNPEAARLLLPVTRRPMLENLFDCVEDDAPELRDIADRFSLESGLICEQHRIFLSQSVTGPQVLACTLLKINADCLMAVLQDVTTQVEQERLLRQSEAMFAALLVGVRDFALCSLDRQGNINRWNRSCERLTGFKSTDVMGRGLSVLSLPEHAREDNVAEQVSEAMREGWSLRERWCAKSNGTRYWCQLMVAAGREIDNDDENSGGQIDVAGNAGDRRSPIAGFAVVLRDVTERHVTGEELRRLLTTDHLTGAINRGRFFELAEIEISRHQQNGRPVSALMLDLDHFKQVNDCFGHAAGDSVLRRFVQVCRKHVRDCDIFARIGGEEFVVLMPNTPLADALVVAEQICRAIPRDVVLPAADCLSGMPSTSRLISTSIGCATLNSSVIGIDALLQAADTALYAAKSAGRGQVSVAPQGAPAAGPR